MIIRNFKAAAQRKEKKKKKKKEKESGSPMAKKIVLIKMERM